MKRFGAYIAIFGIASIILPFFSLQLRFLGWIDNWGETVSWAIKIGLIIVGGIVFFIGNSESEETQIETPREDKPQ